MTTIEVTQADIDAAEPKSPTRTAVALAVNRLTGRFVVFNGFELYFPTVRILVPVPSFVSDWDEDFDAGRPVAPFTFEVQL